jgi:hypothetical protein
MRFAGRIVVAAAAAAAVAPASAAALETREVRVAEPAEHECADRFLPEGTPGVARSAWTAPAEGYLTLKLGGDPSAPDWDLAARSGGATYASTNSGSTEVVTLWVRKGERVAIQACRLSGGDRSVPLTTELFETELPEGEPRASLERVFIEGPDDLAELERLGLDVGHDVTPTAAPVVLHSGAERRLLAQRGFDSEVLVRDLAAADRRQLRREARADLRSNLPSGRDEYRQYADYTAEMKALAAQYPGHVRSITIGTSLEGRPIEGVEIAADVNRTDDGRPVFLNPGLHHAREWPSGELPMEFAIDMARSFGSDPRVTAMLEKTRVIVLPVMNPDGFIASRSYGTSSDDDDPNATLPQIAAGAGAYRRKNCRGVTPADQAIPCALRTTGVDLNRNYGAYWGGPGSSAAPADQTYRGTGPYSEPESQAFLALSQSVHPTVVISNHTFTDEGQWLRQPGFEADFFPEDANGPVTEDEPVLKSLGDRMAAASKWESNRSFFIGSITGATEDWNYFAQGSLGYTPEAKGPNFHANYASMVVAEYLGAPGDPYDGVRGAFLLAGEDAADTSNHGVIAGEAPAGATLRIEKKFALPTCEDADCAEGNGDPVDYEIKTELTVPASGQYSWHVSPSVRPDPYEDRDVPLEAWTMTCKRADQERSPAQQVLIRRGDRAAVDWTGLCGSDPGGGGGGGGQQELPTCGGKEVSIIGTDAGNKIVATEESDVIVARSGNDKVLAGGADDTVCGGGGKDSLKGGGGADELFGQKAADSLKGEKGKDVLRGAKGKDVLDGGPGKNTCVGGSGKDSLRSC